MSARAASQTKHTKMINLVDQDERCLFFLLTECTDIVTYLSDEFLLFGRLRHVVDLLVQLFER